MEIMFDDLTYEAQKRLLEEAQAVSPEDMDWDRYPVAIVEFEDEQDCSDEALLEEEFLEDTYDIDLDPQYN